MSDARKKRTGKSQTASLAPAPSSAPFAFTPDQIVARLRCFSDGAEFEKDEWRQCLFAQAADAIDRLMRETMGLRAALAYIVDEANRHHEHNPISGKARLSRGYMKIINIAAAELNFPQKLSLAPMSEKALKCQRRANAHDSQPEPYPVGLVRLGPAARLRIPVERHPCGPLRPNKAIGSTELSHNTQTPA